jgi:hypothetical protein
MASTPSVPIVSGSDLTTSWVKLYTVPAANNRIVIDAAVFNNYSSSNVTVSIRIAQGATADTFDETATEQKVRAQDNFLAPSIIGQAIGTSGTIWAKASANSSVNANITATLIT